MSVRSKTIREGEAPAESERDASELPEGWATTTLDALFDFKYGKGLRKDTRDDTGVVSVYGSNGVVGKHSSAVTSGPTIIVGRKGSVGEVHLCPEPCWPIDTTYFIDEFPCDLPPSYWANFLKSLGLGDHDKSSAIPGISREDIYKVIVPVPPLAEQRRSVAKLELLLGKVSSSRQRLSRVSGLLKRFRQSVLAAACSGKLTADWREENPDVVSTKTLLEDVERMRSENVVAANAEAGFPRYRYKPAAQIDLGHKTKGIEELFEIPIGWEWVSLGQITWSVADGPHFSPKYVSQADGVPFISGRNISYNGIDLSDAKYVSKEDHELFIKRTKAGTGDVLLTKGGTTGIATVVPEMEEFSVWVHVAVLKPVPQLICSQYLRDVLSTTSAYNQSQAQTHGVGNQDLGLTRMVHIALPLPPLSEQQEIVRRVEKLFAFADQIESRLKQAQAHVDHLTQSLLAKAFRGELVPQKSSDVPASVLLDQLRVERESMKRKTSKKVN